MEATTSADLDPGTLPQTVFFLLYLAQRQPNTYSNYGDMQTLWEWLVPATAHGGELTEFPNYFAPDICGRCLRLEHALALGGRLRDGCWICGRQADTHIWELPSLLRFIPGNKEHVETVFAIALSIFATHRRTQQ